MPRPFRTSCFSFFSLRFSLSVLPDLFDATLRGDLSAMSAPFLRGILPFGGHEDTGWESHMGRQAGTRDEPAALAMKVQFAAMRHELA
jgi:hypothetical protein